MIDDWINSQINQTLINLYWYFFNCLGFDHCPYWGSIIHYSIEINWHINYNMANKYRYPVWIRYQLTYCIQFTGVLFAINLRNDRIYKKWKVVNDGCNFLLHLSHIELARVLIFANGWLPFTCLCQFTVRNCLL